MRLACLSWCLVVLTACSQTGPGSDPDAGADVSSDQITGGSGGSEVGGAGGSGATAGVGGSGGSSGVGGSVGGFGGVAGSGGKSGSGGVGGAGGVGGTAGRGGFAGVGGTGGFAGVGGTGGFDGGRGGFAGVGGFGGGISDGGPAFDAFGSPTPIWPTPICPTGSGSPLLGTWVGYVENHQFSSGSDVLRLTITGADGSTLCGTMNFGDAASLPPPNPDIGYPPGQDWNRGVQSLIPLEGFAHTLEGGLVSGNRVRFQTFSMEPWRVWCGLQTSYFFGGPFSPTHSCINGWGSFTSDGGTQFCYAQNPDTGGREQVDCGKASMCSGDQVCTCNQTGCTANTTFALDFDAQFEAAQAHGSILLYTVNGNQSGTQVFNVNLMRTD